MKTVEINKRIYLVPETWNELTGKQLIRVMEILYSDQPADMALLQLFRIVTGMSWFRFFMCPLDQKAEFLDLAYFLINESNLTRNVLTNFDNLYGPDDDFNNITGEEFVFSEDYYFKSFSISDEHTARVIHEEWLNRLVAVLYRQKKRGYDLARNEDGDPRRPFNQNICEYNAKHIVSKWPKAVKLAIFTWYEACRKQLIESNPDIFSGGGEQAKYGLISVMRVIAEGGIHGTFEQVQKMYVKMWMVELNEKYEESKRATS